MSFKTLIQIFILILIMLIIAGVYYKYFNTTQSIVEEINSSENLNKEQLKDLEKKIIDLELKNQELNNKINENKKILNSKSPNLKLSDQINEKVDTENKLNTEEKNIKKKVTENIQVKDNIVKKKKIKNLVKDVEYTSVDQKGNKFQLLANSGKSNKNNNDILDLINVRGKIMSDTRDTIYIVSDFAQYNSINLNSKFYENVIINYQDKEITCVNFDINMEKNIAIAYNDVLITDPKSTMKAGIVEFDLKTKNININPENTSKEIEVISQTDGIN